MHSIRTKIMATVLALLAVLGVSFVLYSLYTTENYKRMRLANISRTIEFETEKVNKIIAEIETGAFCYSIGGQLTYESQEPAVGKVLSGEYLKSFPSAVGGGFWFEPYAFNESTYHAGFYSFFGDGGIIFDDSDMDEYDYTNSGWYREIFDQITAPQQVVWTKPYIDDGNATRSFMITAGTGVFSPDVKLIGISTLDWQIDGVVESLTATKPTDGSFVLLGYPDKDYIITDTYDESHAGASFSRLAWDVDSDSFELDGIRYMVFRRAMDNGWLLSVQVPENEIFAEVQRQNNRYSLIIAAASIVMLLCAFLLISMQVNKPLKQLTSGVSQLGLGNLDVHIGLTSNDELGLLSRTFDKMTSDLKASIDRIARERAEKERIGAELDVATQIQASMLPCIFPAFPDRKEFDVYASMQPAKEVGGDFYDFFLIDDNTLAVVMADVSGKGVPAALFMVIAKTLIQNTALSGKRPEVVFGIVNKMLCKNNDVGMFVTAFLGYLDIPSGRFTFVNAGHNPPLIKTGEEYGWLKSKAGFVLAGMDDTFYTQQEVTLNPGDELFLYTDGVTEAVNNDDSLFGDPHLLITAKNNTGLAVKEFTEAIKAEIDKFADGALQADDITMLALRYNGMQVDA